MATAHQSPRQTPWGRADYATILVPGIENVSTPSHGGIWLSPERNALVPDYMRHEDGWYEEDCDWCIPFVVFESELKAIANIGVVEAINRGDHVQTLRQWHPDEYERFFGCTLQSGDSYKRDQRNFDARHRNDLQVVCAFGACGVSSNNVPAGMVGVIARVGGRTANGKERFFLVSKAEYGVCGGNFGFIIDPIRHQEVEDFRK